MIRLKKARLGRHKLLGPNRLKILGILLNRQAQGMFPPTLRELQKILGMASPNSVESLLRPLERDGYITREKRFVKARTMIANCRWIPAEELMP